VHCTSIHSLGHNGTVRFDDLPIYPLLPEIAQVLDAGSLVLSAETGAGKTSAVPAYLVSTGFRRGRILVLEPRRLAAVSAAARVAELLDSRVGELVGYRVRGDVRSGPRTIVEFVTEGVFLRMVQDDPLLSGVSVVVFDEFHERSANADLGLAFATEAAGARGDLSILVMSATIDTAAISTWLRCPSITAPGRLYPVTVSYAAPRRGERVEQTVARAVVDVLGNSSGDILVFLPGLREIASTSQAVDALAGAAGGQRSYETIVLHGGLSLRDQRAVLVPPPDAARRVVLATNVAETSVTVPRIMAVVDAGLSRFLRFHAPSGLNQLVTERASLAEAEQRAGRAGRLGPGICVRCWEAGDILTPARGPELSRMELSGVVLECVLRGALSRDATRWLDPPPAHAWDAAGAVLRSIGLLDASGKATPAGLRAASAGLEPRSAAAILKTTLGSAETHTAILAAAALQERDGPDSTGDFREDLERYLGTFPGTDPDGRNTESTRRILEEAERLATRLLAVPRETDTTVGAAKTSAARSFDRKAAADALPRVGDIMATGFPDRLARRLPGDAWEFASGRQARSRLAWPGVDWLLAVDVDAGSPLGYIRRAAPVRAEVALAALETGATESLEVQWRGLSASAWQRISNGVFTLTERRLPAVPPDALAAAFADKLRADGLDWLPWNQTTRALVERVRFMAARKPGLVSLDPREWIDSSLAGNIGKAAAPYLSAAGQALDEAGLAHALATLLGRSVLSVLDEQVPEFVITPAGRKRRPVYPASGPARLSARIQEFFGMARGPRACGEPMTIELLSPADRPIQVTSDLESFWKNTYPAVRGELSRRYPRHYWPADPHQAEPTAGPVRLPRKPRRP